MISEIISFFLPHDAYVLALSSLLVLFLSHASSLFRVFSFLGPVVVVSLRGRNVGVHNEMVLSRF